MKFTLSFDVGRVSFMRVGKAPEPSLLAIDHDGRNVALGALRSYIFENPEYPKLVMRLGDALVLKILTSRKTSQIFEPIVRSNAVDVVNVVWRPFAIYVKPCEAVSKSTPPANSDFLVPSGMITSRNIALATAHTGNPPSENTSLRVVVEKFAQAFCGKIGLSHDALQLLIGQRPGTMGSRYPALSF